MLKQKLKPHCLGSEIDPSPQSEQWNTYSFTYGSKPYFESLPNNTITLCIICDWIGVPLAYLIKNIEISFPPKHSCFNSPVNLDDGNVYRVTDPKCDIPSALSSVTKSM